MEISIPTAAIKDFNHIILAYGRFFFSNFPGEFLVWLMMTLYKERTEGFDTKLLDDLESRTTHPSIQLYYFAWPDKDDSISLHFDVQFIGPFSSKILATACVANSSLEDTKAQI